MGPIKSQTYQDARSGHFHMIHHRDASGRRDLWITRPMHKLYTLGSGQLSDRLMKRDGHGGHAWLESPLGAPGEGRAC